MRNAKSFRPRGARMDPASIPPAAAVFPTVTKNENALNCSREATILNLRMETVTSLASPAEWGVCIY